MTPEQLQRLIATGESLDVEFKGEEQKSLSDDELIEAVVCLANRSSNTPAWLLIGVEDDGRITESRAGRDLGLDDLLILNTLWRGRRLTTEEAARLTQKPEGDTLATLNRLVEIGLVEPRGERKGRTWHLSAATYRRLGQSASYVRQRGFEPLQQKQMVLQYVNKHGRITRKEAAELCQLGPYQATRLLDRLVNGGHLTRRGTKKGAYYERRP